MDKKVLKVIDEASKKLNERIQKKIRNGDSKELRNDIKTLESIESYRSSVTKSFDFRPVIIVISAFLILGAGSLFKTKSTEAKLQATSKGLNFTTAKSTLVDVIKAKLVRFNNLNNASDAHVYPLGDQLKSKNIEIRGEIEIQEIDLSDGTALNLTYSDDDYYYLVLEKGSMVLKFKATDGVYKMSNSENVKLDSQRMIFSFELKPGKGPLTEIKLDIDSLVFSNLPLVSLDFDKVQLEGHQKTFSKIKTGELKLPEKKFEREVTHNDFLSLKIEDTGNVKIRAAQGEITTQYSGEAQSILMNGHELKPTWLQFVYNNESYAFFWATGSFIVGLIWSINNLFRKK